jgi:hypothetical protein
VEDTGLAKIDDRLEAGFVLDELVIEHVLDMEANELLSIEGANRLDAELRSSADEVEAEGKIVKLDSDGLSALSVTQVMLVTV